MMSTAVNIQDLLSKKLDTPKGSSSSEKEEPMDLQTRHH